MCFLYVKFKWYDKIKVGSSYKVILGVLGYIG